MSISETADSFLKGIVNVRDNDTRNVLGVEGFTIVDRDKAFPGVYDFSSGTGFVERGYRGEVGGADYDVLRDSDDPSAASAGLATILNSTIKENLPDYLLEYISANRVTPRGADSVLGGLVNAASINELAADEGSKLEMYADLNSLVEEIDNNVSSGGVHGLNSLIVQNLSYAIRQYGYLQTALAETEKDKIYSDPAVRTELKRASVACATALGNLYSKMLVGANSFGQGEKYRDDIKLLVYSLGAGSSSSPALAEFVKSLSFIADISGAHDVEKEKIIEQRLLNCALEAAEHCGVEYNESYAPGMFIYRLTLNTSPELSSDVLDMAYDAVEDCLNIVDE